MTTIASGHGIATISKGTTLDVWFPSPALSQLTGPVPAELSALVGTDSARAVSREVVSI
jgi:2,3,4,5-tetrahydropyridine-2-carboxylate N-succinyltransferase